MILLIQHAMKHYLSRPEYIGYPKKCICITRSQKTLICLLCSIFLKIWNVLEGSTQNRTYWIFFLSLSTNLQMDYKPSIFVVHRVIEKKQPVHGKNTVDGVNNRRTAGLRFKLGKIMLNFVFSLLYQNQFSLYCFTFTHKVY